MVNAGTIYALSIPHHCGCSFQGDKDAADYFHDAEQLDSIASPVDQILTCSRRSRTEYPPRQSSITLERVRTSQRNRRAARVQLSIVFRIPCALLRPDYSQIFRQNLFPWQQRDWRRGENGLSKGTSCCELDSRISQPGSVGKFRRRQCAKTPGQHSKFSEPSIPYGEPLQREPDRDRQRRSHPE